jgi:hypothetical protein
MILYTPGVFLSKARAVKLLRTENKNIVKQKIKVYNYNSLKKPDYDPFIFIVPRGCFP